MTLESYSAAAVPIDCSQATVPDQIVPTGTTVQASRQVVATDHDVLRLHPNPPHELPNIPYPVKKNLDPPLRGAFKIALFKLGQLCY